MADWDKIESRGRIQDRRTIRSVATGGGIGLGGVAILLVLNLLTGGDIGDVLTQIDPAVLTQQQEQVDVSQFEGQDTYEIFASTVLGSTNDLWKRVFTVNNKAYTPPEFVLFRDYTESLCGGASSQSGPHYCPFDKTIYLDETFFDELQKRFGAEGGDVAEAYVMAHEVGHHVQQSMGILETATDNETSVRMELQADCFAGMWANSIRDRGVFGVGEIREAMDAAAAVGDDRIQEAVTGYVNPESWTHGSSEQRVSWFTKGYETGSVEECDTFGR